MVHTLTEAHHSLKPNGILVDLRPSPKNRQIGRHIGLGVGRNWKSVGPMTESFEADIASDRAIKQVIKDGLFKKESSAAFELDRVMDTTKDLRQWLEAFSVERLTAHLPLIDKIERIQKETGTRKKITVRGYMILNVLRKI